MSAEPVETFFKDNVGDCGCGCGLHGTLKRPWKDGSRCVARVCKCNRCRGKNNRARGHAKQSRAARTLGLVTGKFAPSDEENMGGHLLFEHKATARSAGPVATAYELSRAQAMAAKSVGDTRPFVAGFTPPRSKQMYVVIRSDDLEAFVLADGFVRGFFGASNG